MHATFACCSLCLLVAACGPGHTLSTGALLCGGMQDWARVADVAGAMPPRVAAERGESWAHSSVAITRGRGTHAGVMLRLRGGMARPRRTPVRKAVVSSEEEVAGAEAANGGEGLQREGDGDEDDDEDDGLKGLTEKDFVDDESSLEEDGVANSDRGGGDAGGSFGGFDMGEEGAAGASSLLSWAGTKEPKRKQARGIRSASPVEEESLSGIDDDELDDYITKGVKHEDEDDTGRAEKKKKKHPRAPDISGMQDIVSRIVEEEEGNAEHLDTTMQEAKPPYYPGGDDGGGAAGGGVGGGGAETGAAGGAGLPSAEGEAAKIEAGLAVGLAPAGLPHFQSAGLPFHLRVGAYAPLPAPGQPLEDLRLPGEDGDDELFVPGLGEEFSAHVRDAAVNADRFELPTLGRHLRLENAGKRLVCKGGVQVHGRLDWMRYSSFARTTRDMVLSSEHGAPFLNYLEMRCQGWGSPIYCMVGVTSCADEPEFDYVTYPRDSVVWCQDGKLQWEWNHRANPNMRVPNERLFRFNHRLGFEYGDTIGILVDLSARKAGFVKNGQLLHENTVYDLPDEPLRFVASLYDAGAELVVTPPEKARETLETHFDWSLWNGPPHPQAFASRDVFAGGYSEFDSDDEAAASSSDDQSSSRSRPGSGSSGTRSSSRQGDADDSGEAPTASHVSVSVGADSLGEDEEDLEELSGDDQTGGWGEGASEVAAGQDGERPGDVELDETRAGREEAGKKDAGDESEGDESSDESSTHSSYFSYDFFRRSDGQEDTEDDEDGEPMEGDRSADVSLADDEEFSENPSMK